MIRRRLWNRNGSFLDFFLVVILIFVFAVVLLFVNKAQQGVLTSLNESGTNSVKGQEQLEIGITKFPSMIEGIFTFVVIFLGIGSLILAFTVNYHPVFFVFFMVLLLITILVVPALSNTYQGVYESDDMIGTSSKMPMSFEVMKWFPRIMFVLSLALAVVMFTKGRSGA
jgi:hypothetical protein